MFHEPGNVKRLNWRKGETNRRERKADDKTLPFEPSRSNTRGGDSQGLRWQGKIVCLREIAVFNTSKDEGLSRGFPPEIRRIRRLGKSSLTVIRTSGDLWPFLSHVASNHCGLQKPTLTESRKSRLMEDQGPVRFVHLRDSIWPSNGGFLASIWPVCA